VNKKSLGMILVLLTVVMLAATLVGNAEACCYGGKWRKPVIATVEYSIQVWPVLPQPADYEKITGDNIVMGYKNLATFGTPPLVETYPPTMADFGKGSGGFRLVITRGGEDLELFAAVQKKILLFVIYTDGRAVEISKWSFTIVPSEDATTLGAVGDALEGWLLMRNGKTLITSTTGTGVFEGARLIGDLTTTAYSGGPVIFTVSVGSGLIVFPRGLP